MQTFLPYSNFELCAQVLDYKRLGKQRVEALQIYKCLTEKSNRWKNHPAVLMWKGYENALAEYHNDIITEWIKRGYKNNMNFIFLTQKPKYPWWLGNEDFHRSMRSRLIEKLPDFYSPLFPNDKGFNEGKYLWPVNETETFRMI